MKKWICNYAECDTDYDCPKEREPFVLEANDYEEAMNKADKHLDEYYDEYEFECKPYEDENCDLEFIG
jgi:hypothetical protein